MEGGELDPKCFSMLRYFSWLYSDVILQGTSGIKVVNLSLSNLRASNIHMEPIPLKGTLFCELHYFKVVGVLLDFFNLIFITAACYSVYQKVLSKPKVCGNTERIKKKAWDRQLAQYVVLLDKKRFWTQRNLSPWVRESAKEGVHATYR